MEPPTSIMAPTAISSEARRANPFQSRPSPKLQMTSRTNRKKVAPAVW